MAPLRKSKAGPSSRGVVRTTSPDADPEDGSRAPSTNSYHREHPANVDPEKPSRSTRHRRCFLLRPWPLCCLISSLIIAGVVLGTVFGVVLPKRKHTNTTTGAGAVGGGGGQGLYEYTPVGGTVSALRVLERVCQGEWDCEEGE